MVAINGQQFQSHLPGINPDDFTSAEALDRLDAQDAHQHAHRFDDAQLWKGNPNQMALPGMEKHAHAGAEMLARGVTFKTAARVGRLGQTMGLYAHVPVTKGGVKTGQSRPAAELLWKTGSGGEINWVHTKGKYQGKGIASTLYGVGRDLATVQPNHSAVRTTDGDAFAHSSSNRYGGFVPTNAESDLPDRWDDGGTHYSDPRRTQGRG